MESNKIRVAVIDLYNNEENQGLRCIKDILVQADGLYNDVQVDFKFYDTRFSGSAPDSKYDIYISSGGPGSPWEGEGTEWESKYFSLMDSIWSHNQNSETKKYVFFICHSFQIMARYFKIADVVERNSKSFGVMPVHKTLEGSNDFLLKGLPEPFYGADFRQWQVVNPDKKIFDELGAQILCLEKDRPHIPLERAMMAIRINNEFVGTQFHPEADAASMRHHLFQPERKEHVISKYGEEKYNEMLELLERPDGMLMTQKKVLPNFLKHAIEELRR
ncbi:MAG: GMP synthase [Ignavibacteriae bacterium HGW-Ignavibacteriae-3]|nr:MAG: GMP synthase [Ignavibacteriae bacterium HGW-Ignavibacteriae-3]